MKFLGDLDEKVLKDEPRRAWCTVSQHYLLSLFTYCGSESDCLVGESTLVIVSCPFLPLPVFDTCSRPLGIEKKNPFNSVCLVYFIRFKQLSEIGF